MVYKNHKSHFYTYLHLASLKTLLIKNRHIQVFSSVITIKSWKPSTKIFLTLKVFFVKYNGFVSVIIGQSYVIQLFCVHKNTDRDI
jgi:hypothetical protein